jgi:hypothetical protein
MRYLCATVALLLLSWSVAGAKTIALNEQGASIDLPADWNGQQSAVDSKTTTASVILTAANARQSSGLQLLVCANPKGLLAVQPDVVAHTKESITNQILSRGGQVKFSAEMQVALNNVPAYLFQYTETTTSSKQVETRLYQLAANGKLYLISLRTLDPSSDAELESIANSFRFDSPPVLPVPAAAPPHRLRYYLMAAAGVVVLIVAGIGFYYYRQRQIYE